jgi:large subunit ribosomal protein L15
VRLHELAAVEADVIDLVGAQGGQHHPPGHAARQGHRLLGTLDKAVTIRGYRVTKGARAAIEAAGGKVEE